MAVWLEQNAAANLFIRRNSPVQAPLLPLKYGLLSTFAGICPEDFACLRKVIVYQGCA